MAKTPMWSAESLSRLDWRHGRPGAVTLVEALATLAILAIIASIVAPKFVRQDAEPSAKNEAEIIRSLQDARREALWSGRPVAWTMPRAFDESGEEVSGLPALRDEGLTASTVTFFPDGTAKPAIVRSGDGRLLTVDAAGAVERSAPIGSEQKD